MSLKASPSECELLAFIPTSLTGPNSKHIQFQPFTPKDIVRISEVEVTSNDLYTNHEDGSRTTAKDGPLDARMVSIEVAALANIAGTK